MGGPSSASPPKGPGRTRRVAGTIAVGVVVGVLVLSHGGLQVLSALMSGH
jgi:hypothetical protein